MENSALAESGVEGNGEELGHIAGRVDNLRGGALPQPLDVVEGPGRIDQCDVTASSGQSVEVGKEFVIENLQGSEKGTARHESGVVVGRFSLAHTGQHIRADGRIVDVWRGTTAPQNAE